MLVPNCSMMLIFSDLSVEKDFISLGKRQCTETATAETKAEINICKEKKGTKEMLVTRKKVKQK